jgi:hypothetical protein
VGAHSVLVDDCVSHHGTVASVALGGEGKGDGCKSTARAMGGRAYPLGDGTAADDVPVPSLLLPPSRAAMAASDAIGIATDTTTMALSRSSGGSGRLAVGAGRRKRKIFPLASPANDERDKLHVKIYRYFRWLQDLLLLSMSSSTSLSLPSLCTASDSGIGIGGTTAKSDETNVALSLWEG